MWVAILCLGITFLILEMMMPSIFFLNFALSAFICTLISFFVNDLTIIAICFCVFSIISIYFLRPLLIKNQVDKKQDSGIGAKYIGKIATVIEKVDDNNGVISLYDERWQARAKENETIEVGSKVEIVGNNSLIMFVKSIESKE